MYFLHLTTFYFCTECTKLNSGDLFKLMIPIEWTVVALASLLAYVFTQVSQGKGIPWGSACVVVVIAGVEATYAFLRYRQHAKTPTASTSGRRLTKRLRYAAYP